MTIEYLIIAALVIALSIISIRYKEALTLSNHQKDRADRYYFAIKAMDKWCRHELPEVEVIVNHLIAKGEGLFMNAGTPAGKEACTVSGLREQIRNMKVDKSSV